MRLTSFCDVSEFRLRLTSVSAIHHIERTKKDEHPTNSNYLGKQETATCVRRIQYKYPNHDVES
jgi:hypothetical protein